MQLQYNQKVLEHFRNPRNLGVIKKPDGEAMVGNPICGDVMKMMIKVGTRQVTGDTKEEYIKEIKFQTLGCGAAISTSSILTEMAKGKSLDEAMKIKNEDVVKELGGLPLMKMHCSVLAVEALRKAIRDYRKKRRNKFKVIGF